MFDENNKLSLRLNGNSFVGGLSDVSANSGFGFTTIGGSGHGGSGGIFCPTTITVSPMATQTHEDATTFSYYNNGSTIPFDGYCRSYQG